jgi:acid phosphatase
MMQKIVIMVAVLCIFGLSDGTWAGADTPTGEQKPTGSPWPKGLPVYEHVVIVMEENKDYDQLIGNPAAPYINALANEGANFTQMYGEEHYSQGNYFWLFSGSNQTLGFNDVIPSKNLMAANLGQSLIAKGRSFKGYAEDLPAIGSTTETTQQGGTIIYARKHVPWISFANVPNGNTEERSCNLRFADFPTDPARFATLPTVAFVVPNQENDMHNGEPEKSVPAGDLWLKKNLDSYYQWAKTHQSLLIVTFDESDDKTGYVGLTNPLVHPTDQFKRDLQNRIPTIFAGAHIKAGNYSEGRGITHVNILRTLEAMFGLPKVGAQQPNAAGAGIADEYIITDIFEKGN